MLLWSTKYGKGRVVAHADSTQWSNFSAFEAGKPETVRLVDFINHKNLFPLYFAHGAVHAPLQAKPADIEKYKDAYHAGWDRIREARFRRQLDLGVRQ